MPVILLADLVARRVARDVLEARVQPFVEAVGESLADLFVIGKISADSMIASGVTISA